jgi:hypothetical protein
MRGLSAELQNVTQISLRLSTTAELFARTMLGTMNSNAISEKTRARELLLKCQILRFPVMMLTV